MNYRHAFHAGNHADVLKHLCLVLILERLAQKPAPFAVLDTHAGSGGYRLDGEDALRSPEWRDGVGRVWDWPDAPPALAPYQALLRRLNPEGALSLYPGSPVIALEGMRAEDRLIACDLHPEEAALLRRAVRADARAQIHNRDGFEAVGALLPLAERRGLVLIDPPYEDRVRDIDRSIAALRKALGRFANGVYLWWRPVKDPDEIDLADRTLLAGGALKFLRADLAVDRPERDRGLAASSVLIVNPPHTLEPQLREALPALTQRLGRSSGAGWRLESRE